MTERRRQRGFNLVELIIVITVTGIIGGIVAVFLKGPIDAYFDTARRALLTDTADTAMRFIARETRLALPNSVRIAGSDHYLEFVPSPAGGPYRRMPGGGSSDFLNFDTSDTSFEAMGPVIQAAANDFLVIYNTGQKSNTAGCTGPGADVYEGCNRRTISGYDAGTGILTFTSSKPMPLTSPQQRFFIVPGTGPVSYACETLGKTAAGDGAGQLVRYTGYQNAGSDWSAQPTTFTVSGAVLADKVEDCQFTYVSGVVSRFGLVILRLKLTRNNESVNLLHQFHVENLP